MNFHVEEDFEFAPGFTAGECPHLKPCATPDRAIIPRALLVDADGYISAVACLDCVLEFAATLAKK